MHAWSHQALQQLTILLVQPAGGLTAALTRAGSGHLQGTRSPSNAEEWTDPLSVAAMELIQRDRLVSQSSAIASALQVLHHWPDCMEKM